MASQIPGVSIVYSTVSSGADKKTHKKTSKLRVTGLCEGNSPHKGPVTMKMFPFDDVTVIVIISLASRQSYDCSSASEATTMNDMGKDRTIAQNETT